MIQLLSKDKQFLISPYFWLISALIEKFGLANNTLAQISVPKARFFLH